MNRLWRGLLGLALLFAFGLALFGVVLVGFAQIAPAIVAFILAFGIALMAGPAFWRKMPHDRGAYERRTH